MKIKWNEYTWYSKLSAAIFFILVLPAWTFYIGTQYEATMEVIGSVPSPIGNPVPPAKPTPPVSTPLTSGIIGTVTLGPTCPVQRTPPDSVCADRPYATTLDLLSMSGVMLKKITVDESGKFTVNILPGQYQIKSASAALYPRLTQGGPIVVVANTYTTVHIQFDSGIR